MDLSNAFILIIACIKYDAQTHPTILGDNRHYFFYIFRYTILYHPLIRYLLAPVYILSFYLIYRAVSTPSTSALPQPNLGIETLSSQSAGPRTSFVLIFFLSTALSLTTTPLVEPRNFIIPWIIWRLHVPVLSYSDPQKKIEGDKSRESMLTRVVGKVRPWIVEGGGLWLWGETFWFLLINSVTGYAFLYQGFERPQEPGNVQRLMW